MDTLKYWVWITLALGPANNRVWELTSQYENILEAYEGISGGNYKGMTPKEISAFKATHIDQAEKMIDYCNSKGIRIITFDDDVNYPCRLRDIYNPPTIIFCYGDISFIDNSIALGVVGARKPSEYSIKVTEIICTELAKVGTVLISGFAYGIDSIAHKTALKNNVKTVAVLGCGIDYDYPKENAKIKKVIAMHGAVISEYFPGTKPFQEYFRQRNRLISGLSLGVLIAEASSTSGALNTASHALQQGKDIFCIPPHDIFDEKYAGVTGLMRDGAIPVFSHIDIMYEYFDNFSHKLESDKPFENFFIKSSEVNKINIINDSEITTKNKQQNKKRESTNDNTIDIDVSILNDIQINIIELLKNNSMIADDITVQLNLEISDVLIALTELELLGYIKALPGKRYSL